MDHAFIARALPFVPPWLRSHHLTLLTLGWSALIVAIAVLAQTRPWLLWVSSVVVMLQYMTDAIDGKIGRLRNEGLVRWGYYVDHFLDYVFLSAILFGYAVLVPPPYRHLMVAIMGLAGAFMVSVFLERAVTGRLRQSVWGIGPFEMRLVFVAINTTVLCVGEARLLNVLPWAMAAAIVALGALVFQTQARLWRLDITARERKREVLASEAVQEEVRHTDAPERPTGPVERPPVG